MLYEHLVGIGVQLWTNLSCIAARTLEKGTRYQKDVLNVDTIQ